MSLNRGDGGQIEMIGYLKVNNLRYAVYATPKFGSCQFLIKPESLEAAIYAEGIDTSKVQTLMSAFEDDWHFCKYRADIAPGKIDTTLGNKELAVALAIAFNAAKKAVQKKHSQFNDGSYHSVWCEQIVTSDNLESKMYFSLGLVSSFWLRTPYLELFVKDEELNLEIGTPDDFYTYYMHELRDECNKYPMFKSLSSEALKLYTLTQHYSTSSEYLTTLLPKRSGYRAIKLSSAMKFPGAAELSFEVKSKEIATDVYSTIRQVREAHPDKSTDWIEQCNYVMVTDENLSEIMKSLWAAPIISFDTETTGLKINFMSREGLADELVGVCLSDKMGTGYYFPLQHKLFKNLCDSDHRFFMLTYLKELLEKKPIVCHNLSYDWKVAYIYDINVNCVFDTMLAFGVTKRYEYIGFQTGLKALCSMLFHIDMFEIADFVIGKWDGSSVTFADLPYELVAHYGPADADITLRLYYWCLQNKLLDTYNAQRVFNLEVNFAKVVAYSEFWGYHIDVAQLPALEKDILDGMHSEQSELYRIAGKEFNANSSKQLQQIMYEDLKMPPMDDKKSTAKEILGAFAKQTDADGNPLYPFAYHLLEYRKYESVYKNFLKKKDTYVSPDGYVFAEVQQLGTNTGRVSIKEPNYQSYNDVVKQRVTGRPGYYIFDCDFAQIEYRVLASMAGQEALIKAFDDPDLDYHTHQAARMFSVPYAAVSKKLRQQSKGINFGLPYGMGDESLGKRVFGTKSPENTAKAADLRKRFFEGQEKIQEFFTRVRENGVRNGYTETWLGRRRYYHKTVFSDGAIRRQAGNHAIQGCLHGDVRIQTKEYGIVRISSVAGQALHVWDGKDWTRGIVTPSGLKRECVVHFTNGQGIHCSPNHKFAIQGTNSSVFARCDELKAGTAIERNINTAHGTDTLFKCEKDGALIVDYVEKTENFIPMYDVCDTERGYFVADGIVTHNSAADIWKTAVVRFFNRVVKEGWLGKVLFDGFIHDELMGECSVDIDPYEFIKAWREEYELSIDKFCKLYAGFGWGNSWYEAKKADYPPYFISQIIAKGSEPHTWNGDYKTLIKQTKEDLYQYEIKRVVDWVKAQKTGTIIAPHINAYLYDKMSDFWSDIVAKHPELENSSLKKLSLDDILVLFAEHEGFEYTPGTILAPDAAKPVDVSPTGTVEEAELTEEQLKQLQMNKQQHICQNVLNFGFLLDPSDMILYLKYTGEPIRQMFEGTYCSELAKSDIRVIYLIFNPDKTVSAMPSKKGIAMSDLDAVNNFVRGVIMRG